MTESPKRKNSTWPINLFDLEWIDLFEHWNKPLPSICNQLKADSALQIKISQCVSARETKVHLSKTSCFCHGCRKGRCWNEASTRVGYLNPSRFYAIAVVKKNRGQDTNMCWLLKAALESNNYPLPVPEDVFSQLNGCKYFSIIDLSDTWTKWTTTRRTCLPSTPTADCFVSTGLRL